MDIAMIWPKPPRWLWSRTFLSLALLWTAGVGAALAVDLASDVERTLALAETWARSALQQDLTYRRWASMHGGVYVPPTDQTPPNPFLEGVVPERDVTTTSGRQLTLVNPAYMTRQVHQLSSAGAPPLAHITSLKPLRPENGPDEWEREALEAFEAGATQKMEVVDWAGEPTLRLMIPLRADAECLTCHAAQGYSLGDIRGGLSNSVPLARFRVNETEHRKQTTATFGIIWLIGLGVLGAGSRSFHGYVGKLAEGEKSLRQSQALLLEAQRIGRMGHYSYDIEAGTWTGSETLSALFGMDTSRPLPVSGWLEVVHPEDRAEMGRYVAEEVVGRGSPFDREYRIVRRDDGEVRWVRGFGEVATSPEGGPLRLVGTIQDVTDWKSAEGARRASEARLRSLAASIPDIIFRFRFSPDPGFEYVSPAVVGMVGYTPEELYADPRVVYTMIHPDDHHFVRDALEGKAVGDTPRVLRWIRKDGSVVWVEQRVWTAKDVEGEVVALEGISRDVTARVEAEAERDELVARLAQSQRLEAVGRLAGGVAHDFNNMLAVILGQLDLTLDGPLSEAVRQQVEAAQAAATRSADLTRQLLAFARQQAAQPRVLDLNQTITGMMTLLTRIIGEDIDLRWEPGVGLAPVFMDPTQVDQILANLVVNARDAIEGQGVIRLSTSEVTLDVDFCQAYPNLTPGPHVRIVVEDDGVGMDADTAAEIFEPFFTTKEMGHGSGLGLATVYGVVQQNGGAIDVDSQPGEGSVFSIYLPACDRQVDDVGGLPAQAPVAEPAGDVTVLVVEDEPGILNLISQMLRRAGYGVVTASTPREALRLAEEHEGSFSALLTDVVMPEMDGLALANILREGRPDLAVVFMSGYSESLLSERGVVPGELLILTKPFSRADLLRSLDEALKR